jgi:hypothetical protein
MSRGKERQRVQGRLLMAWVSLTLGCSDSGQSGAALGPPESANPTQVRGAVQKGPFVVGSSITLSILDQQLNPTGQVFNTQTSNDRGEFEIGLSATSPISLQGSGFYYNEVLGTLSGADITLRAFYVPSGTGVQEVYVNMVTHLTTERIKALVESGVEFSNAVADAESELIGEFGITEAGYIPAVRGTSMNIAGADNADNAYLLGVSCVMILAAVERSGGSVDAALQEALNSFSLDLSDGTLEAPRKAEVVRALASIDTAAVSRNLAQRLVTLGSTDPVPNMNRVLDQDRDGVGNEDDSCAFVADDQADTDGDGLGDPCDPCPNTPCEFKCLPANPDNGGPPNDVCYEPGTLNVECRIPSVDDDPNTFTDCNAGLVCVPNVRASSAELCWTFGSCCLASGGASQVCGEDDACGSGLDCLSNVSGCPGDKCCIRVGGEGERCHVDDTCNGSLNCVDDECIVASGLNEPCAGPTNGCDPGLECTANADCTSSNGLCCRVAGDEGQECFGEQANSCHGELSCVLGSDCSSEYGLDRCCLLAGELGQHCIWDGGSTLVCEQGLHCVNIVAVCDEYGIYPCCSFAGNEGQPCMPQDQCNNEGVVDGVPFLECISAGAACPEGFGNEECCVPTGGLGEVCMFEGQLGNPCEGDLECVTGAACDGVTPNCCQPPASPP